MESDIKNNKQEDIVELQEIEFKHATKEIPDSTQESEKKNNIAHQATTIPTNKQPSIEERSSLFTILSLPLFNAVATIIFIAITILAFSTAYGMPVEAHIAGMSYPSFIGLMMALILLLLGDGIGYALSEYKWIRFERKNTPLSLLEAYDACSNGLGGVFRSVYAFRLDYVLVIAVLFHFGILATAPLAQRVLLQNASNDFVNCMKADSSLSAQITNISRQDFTTYNPDTRDPRSIKTYIDHSLITRAFRLGFTGYLFYYDEQNNTLGWDPHLKLPCPGEALSCNYTTTVTMPYLKPVCQKGIFNTTVVDTIFGNTTKLLDLFFEPNDLYEGGMKLVSEYQKYQAFFYHSSMENSTFYYLNNLTQPYPESARRVVQPRFVALMKNESFNDHGTWYAENLLYAARIHDCTFQPMINVTEYAMEDQKLTRRRVISSTPVEMDYDALNDPAYWQRYGEEGTDYTMANMYAMQLSVLKNMIIDIDIAFPPYQNDKIFYQFDTFLYKMADTVAENIAMLPPPLHQGDPIEGDTVCMRPYMQFRPDPASYLPLMLCLLIPLLWWLITWLWSLKQAGWISRGNSQIALVLHDLTSTIRRRLGDLSYMDQFSMMIAARSVRTKLGEPKSDHVSSDPLVFGHRNDVDPRSLLRGRRKSI
ncbi:hypothetical protein O0I10_002971 [Lichtheimia ornata]|uniref:Uncharacterized protein n=1 Tax=Lichtheimia ornata TaxID=688661 RepID=A0AAD7Y2L3_9FUNG|nr:uncharacterized protein O0I10_002971 [Lichtheimia ornata]KAJ8661222.1 hypothetical protein O0I10_002971 [Lichtheimia ornata]